MFGFTDSREFDISIPKSRMPHGQTHSNNFFGLPAFNSITNTEPDAQQSILTENSTDFYQKKSDLNLNTSSTQKLNSNHLVKFLEDS